MLYKSSHPYKNVPSCLVLYFSVFLFGFYLTLELPKHMFLFSKRNKYLHFLVSSFGQQAEQLGREDQQRLHRNKKLVLMVDLDQTLIHTTEQHCQRMSNKVLTSTRLVQILNLQFMHFNLTSTCRHVLF